MSEGGTEKGVLLPKDRQKLRFKPVNNTKQLRSQLMSATTELTKVKENSFVDTLTEIPNEKAFFAMMSGLQDLNDRDYTRGIYHQGTFIVLDLTGLHEVNDGYGKLAGGDDYLKSVAKTLKENSRPEDRFFRMGTSSDEFTLHLHDVVREDELTKIMDRIDEKLHEHQEQNQNKYPGIEFGVSYAVASYGKGYSPKKAYEDATNRLGEAKQSKNSERVGDVGRLFVNKNQFL